MLLLNGGLIDYNVTSQHKLKLFYILHYVATKLGTLMLLIKG